jgi:hypothetical protein
MFVAKDKQNLSDAEAEELLYAYDETFIKSEKQHVLNKDPYGSIFGGRIREVRTDPYEDYKLYIVMESISGDHQRICFVATGDEDDNWMITGIMDSEGYTKMISEGTQD